MSADQDYIAALEAAGHDDAAALLKALPSNATTPASEQEQDREPQVRLVSVADAAQAARQAHGRALLDAMPAPGWVSTSAFGSEAGR